MSKSNYSRAKMNEKYPNQFTFRCVSCKDIYGSSIVGGFPPSISLMRGGEFEEHEDNNKTVRVYVWDSVCIKCWEEKNGNWTRQHPRLHKEGKCDCKTPPSKEAMIV